MSVSYHLHTNDQTITVTRLARHIVLKIESGDITIKTKFTVKAAGDLVDILVNACIKGKSFLDREEHE